MFGHRWRRQWPCLDLISVHGVRWAICLALLLVAGSARAETVCPDIDGGTGALAAVDVEVRLAFVRAQMARGRLHGAIWMGSWATVHSGLLLTQGILLSSTTNPADRIDHYVALGASGVGLLSVLAGPPAALTEGLRLEKHLREASPHEDRCVLLLYAERSLMKVARKQLFSRGPFFHAGSFVFNIGLGLLLGLGFGHWETAAITSGVGILTGELIFFTQPNRAPEDLTRYRNGQLHGSAPTPVQSFFVAPRLDSTQTMISAGFAF